MTGCAQLPVMCVCLICRIVWEGMHPKIYVPLAASIYSGVTQRTTTCGVCALYVGGYAPEVLQCLKLLIMLHGTIYTWSNTFIVTKSAVCNCTLD